MIGLSYADLDTAYQDGRDAHDGGLTLSACPYSGLLAKEWHKGWSQRERECTKGYEIG